VRGQKRSLLYLFFVLFTCSIALTQATTDSPSTLATPASGAQAQGAIPRLIRFSGTLRQYENATPGQTLSLTFGLYKDAQGGAPLWTETQNVQLTASGRYSVLLGATQNEGLPLDLFTGGDARWLGIQVAGEGEQPRVLLVSVPYAMKAADAETLGGKPLSAFVLANPIDTSGSSAQAAAVETGGTTTAASGTANYIAKFINSTDLGNSSLFDTGNAVAVGSTSPATGMKFDVAGAAQFRANAGFGNIAMRVANSNAGARFFISAADDISFYGDNGANILIGGWTGAQYRTNLFVENRIGNIGIGTTFPNTAFKLDVNGSAQFKANPSFGDLSLRLLDSMGGSRFLIATTPNEARFHADNGADLSLGGWNGSAYSSNIFIQNSTGRVGMGTVTPTAKLEVVGSVKITNGSLVFPDGSTQSTAAASTLTGSTPNSIFVATQNGAGTTTPIETAPPPSAVRGVATATSDMAAGVLGQGYSGSGSGVLGLNYATEGNAVGVAGYSLKSPYGIGVYGQADTTATNAATVGVYGVTTGSWPSDVAANGVPAGVVGEATATSGLTTGVYGAVESPDGYGVEGDSYAASGLSIGVAGFSRSTDGRGVLGRALSETGATYGVRGLSDSNVGTGLSGEAFSPEGRTVGVHGQVASPTGVGGLFVNTSGVGNILIGRNSDSLANVFRVAGNGDVYGRQFLSSGADFAESFAVKGDKAQYEPGDVLAIDETGTRRLKVARGRYSKAVAGVYSTKPGVLASPYDGDSTQRENEVPLAVVGVVPCKVTAENGPIKPGDLLVVSSTPGYAMRGTDYKRMTGAIVGKALQPLASGKGVIQILVTLQ